MTCQPCILPPRFRGNANRMTPTKIINAVCIAYDVTYDQLRAPARGKEPITNARHMAVYIIRKHTSLSLNDVARLLSRTHTTVMHAQRRITNEKGICRGIDMQEYHKKKYREVMEMLR